MSYEPDLDEHGRALADPTAYSLRRAICSYLMNCAAAPRLFGEKIPLSVLVDILMDDLRFLYKLCECFNRIGNALGGEVIYNEYLTLSSCSLKCF